jgi:hypothetical protein
VNLAQSGRNSRTLQPFLWPEVPLAFDSLRDKAVWRCHAASCRCGYAMSSLTAWQSQPSNAGDLVPNALG